MREIFNSFDRPFMCRSEIGATSLADLPRRLRYQQTLIAAPPSTRSLSVPLTTIVLLIGRADFVSNMDSIMISPSETASTTLGIMLKAYFPPGFCGLLVLLFVLEFDDKLPTLVSISLSLDSIFS